jgi:type III restriction enzyme
MALHKNFPKDPYEIISPELRWFPADESLREEGEKKLIPPLVATLRRKVEEWRNNDYEGATETSKALLKWWFETEHPITKANGEVFNFRYYFCQREAVETIIYLHDIAKIKTKFDLMQFDSSGRVSTGMFQEEWKRFVIKMATGSGKTKVLSLLLAWSYFSKLYEEQSDLSRNFLIIAPNIIVLERLFHDFQGLNIFYEDPILPENGYFDRNWDEDFQLTLHKQDEVNITKKVGNVFLTNIHRVFENNKNKPVYSANGDNSEFYLGSKPTGETNESMVDLGEIVRDIDELMIMNDEAHHIHDEKLAWFKSIQDIYNKLLQKEKQLSMQIDVTATPKGKHGEIFVQTISDYPLVEAIYQDIVKHPIVPDQISKQKLKEKKSTRYSERFEDYIHLGYLEWKKVYDEQMKNNKKAVLFIMTDDTKNCDELAKDLEIKYPDLKDQILVIHTKDNGEISETATGKSQEELIKLRKEANSIDKLDNPHKVIISVLMLKEGWDVQNVTTIVGLRSYTSENKILPEQTLGRGLRRMYRGENIPEYVSVVGSDKFMDFIQSIKTEGVELEQRAMGEGTAPKSPLIVEIDRENMKKDIQKLDIEIPILTPRVVREWKNLSELDISTFKNKRIPIKIFSEEEKREIIFKKTIQKDNEEQEIHHTTILDNGLEVDFESIVGFFTRTIMAEMRLFSGYDVLYPKVKEFIEDYLFEKPVDLEDANVIRNLSEIEATKTIFEIFKKKINELTIKDKGEAEIRDYIKMSKSRPFVIKNQSYLIPKKSVFNRIIGDSEFELKFADFLEGLDEKEIISYAKNYFAVHFELEYKNSNGELSKYIPDFIIKKSEKEMWIIETKGQEDLDVPLKIERLDLWCKDINEQLKGKVKYDWVLVDYDSFMKQPPRSFEELIKSFKKYKKE